MANKVALILTGHYRSFDSTYPIWKEKVIDKYHPDVYMHIWRNIGNRLDVSPSDPSPPGGALANARFSSDLVSEAKIKNDYGINNLVIEDYFTVEATEKFRERTEPIKEEFISRGLGDRRMIWFPSQYYKRLKGVEWAMSQGQYDLIMLSRPDFLPDQFGKLKQPLTELNSSRVYATLYSSQEGYHDYYLIASPVKLLEICNIYHSLEYLFNWAKANGLSRMSCGHSLLTHYLEHIQCDVIQIPLLGHILRER